MNRALLTLTVTLAGVAAAQFAQNRTLPTSFPIDCRALDRRPSAPEAARDWNARCQRVADQWSKGTRLGTGPSVAQLASAFPTKPGSVRYWGGFLDERTRKLYIGATWSDNRDRNGDPELKNFGLLLEVDVDFSGPAAGNRRVISGKHLSRQGDLDVGSGPKLSTVRTVRRGPDGALYAFTMDAGNPATIVRIDPQSGDRRVVWQERAILHNQPGPFPADQCDNGQTPGKDGVAAGGRRSMQINGAFSPFEMNPRTGEFYLAPIQANNASPQGLLKISADGAQCSWVTRLKAAGSNRYADTPQTRAEADSGQPTGSGPRGSGFSGMTLNATNLHYREQEGRAWLYASSGASYWRTDLESGNRELVVQQEVGDTNSVWDERRRVLWTSGTGSNSGIAPVTIEAEEPRLGGNLYCLNPSDATYQCVRGPGEVGPLLRGGVFLDPRDGNLIVAHDGVGLIRIEIATGNSYLFSL